ncbi:large ribosomal subunit protein bL34m [Plodia interpunctella]|uniref:large ribosomal subunit protein bL34m n=1 Tax=Plodia interpunctella TaxID=58824 RepID=UPI002368216C|nr:39S ribosomal protein L34, mitochondrial [Plodia interpunctella]
MSGLLRALFQPLKLFKQTMGPISSIPPSTALVKSEYPILTTIRTKVRCYFPRPNEVRRVRRHGWKTRMSTPAGRRTIMRRLLKGRFVLSH